MASEEISTVSYEDLAELEKDFDEVEAQIMRQQTALTAPLYAKRQSIVSKIPHFWSLVLEQSPLDIDQFLQPSDTAVFATALTDINVTRLEIPPVSANGNGSPRSVEITFSFAKNEYFEDSELRKTFWYRRAADGWTGLVSDPVRIHWKKGKDLTEGLLEAVYDTWEAEKKVPVAANGSIKRQSKKELLPEQKALINKIEKTSQGALSFFAWFGFRGRHISAKESEEAIKMEQTRRQKVANGEKVEPVEETQEDEDEEDLEADMEIFPAGEDLAISISDDLWPGALKYFTQAQEQEEFDDMDSFPDSDDEDHSMDEVNIRGLVGASSKKDSEDEDRPKKKAKKT